ncbi:MAG: Calx-beta domain-containing protein [Planctomycetota bacterium]
MRKGSKNLAKQRRLASRRRSLARRSGRVEGLESRELLTTVVFQEGLDDYVGQEDTVIYSREPNVNFGTEGSISPDQQDANGARQGLVQFGDIIGDQPGQIPVGSKINSATLTLEVVNPSNTSMQMSLYRMLTPWSESTATWNTFGAIGGVQASEGESSDLPPDAILYDSDTSGASATAGIFDVTKSVTFWALGAENYGWMVESSATDGWDFRTKESAQNIRPRLTVDFTAPSGAGEFEFLDLTPVLAEGDTGDTTYMLDVARLGGITGAASVDYAITAGTATAGTDFVAASGTLNFADGETFQQLPVSILGDTALEGNETLSVTLTGDVVAGQDVATVTIGDDDALINEVLANITEIDSAAGDETDREFIELIGTPGASLDDYYFVVFEGEEEENGDTAGSATGTADIVVDLSSTSFGSNGLLVITPTNWEYTAAAGTSVVVATQLDGPGGGIEDASQTYALIYSPNAPIVQGTDYDVIGAYVSDSRRALDSPLGELGVLDALPAGAQVLDSVGVVEGGGSDRDRTLTPPELGNPGIHVHQPTGLNAESGGVTSDAVSRRIGQKIGNSIGAWYNGDVANTDVEGSVIPYQNDTFFISVVAPDGALLTPGAPNVLRNVFFSVDEQSVSVDEQSGNTTVTVNIERTGDIASESVDVTYTTVDGTAEAGLDYAAKTETVTFAPGVDKVPVEITILADSVAEGFERFNLEITDATGDYLITNGQSTRADAVNGLATVTINDGDVQIATFQNGVSGYFGVADTTLDGELTTTNLGFESSILVDQVKGVGEDVLPFVRPQQALLRFDDLFGAAANQIPEGSQVFDAFITINVSSIASGAEVGLFKLEKDWDGDSATWRDPQGIRGGEIVDGVTPDGAEAGTVPDARVVDPGRAGLIEIPLSADTLQEWANGSDENFGWSIISDSESLFRFDSSEATLPGTFRPQLTVLYTDPVANDAGLFGLADAEYSVNESGSVDITIIRKGGSFGSETVDWALTPGTASAGDVSSSLSGSVTFADGELFKTFTVTPSDDSLLESNETLAVSISGSGLDFTRTDATLTIRDNDYQVLSGGMLLNEFFINSPGNDPPSEFVELKGPAGAALGSLYYVAIESTVGNAIGTAEKVVDLSDFANGGNGYTVITPDAADFAYEVAGDTTQIDLLGPIATENVASANDSTTYLLLYSPDVDLTEFSFDYDWNDDGSLDLPGGVEIVDSLGVKVFAEDGFDQFYGPSLNQDQLNLTDQSVDAISRDRNSTAANRGADWFGGDLVPANDDYLLYRADAAAGLPVDGASVTPGEVNVGNATESPLVSLISSTQNGDGSVTLTFNGPITQELLGEGTADPQIGAGISITDDAGVAIPGVSTIPTLSGFGTNELTVSFSGSQVVDGRLPNGLFQLNVVGNGLVGNGRAVDAANTGSPTGSAATLAVGVVDGDFNADGRVDNTDLNLLLNNWGEPTVPSNWVNGFTGPAVNNDELNALLDNWGFGAGESSVALAQATVASDEAFADLEEEEAAEETRKSRERGSFRKAVRGMRG